MSKDLSLEAVVAAVDLIYTSQMIREYAIAGKYCKVRDNIQDLKDLAEYLEDLFEGVE